MKQLENLTKEQAKEMSKIWYIQNYLDVLNGSVYADRNTKEHFEKLLKIELNKYMPYVNECKSKNIKASKEIVLMVSGIQKCLNKELDLFS